jgi:hypothetical protein
MRITSAGNVGIGTASPVSGQGTPLTLESSTGFVGITFRGTGSSDNIWQLYSSNSGGVKFFGIFDRTNNAYRLIANSLGNVLINTITDAGFKLDVNGTGAFTSTSSGAATNVLTIRNSGSTVVNTEARLFLSTVAADNRGAYISAIITSTSNDNALVLATNAAGASPTERWRITATGILQSNGAQTIQTSTGNLTLATAAGNGNIVLTPHGTGDVGIGVTNMSSFFNQASNLVIGNTGNVGLTIYSSTGGNNVIAFADVADAANSGFNAGGCILYAHSDNSMRFRVNGAERFSIASTGAATFSSSVTGQQGVNIGANALGTDRMFQVSGTAFTSGANQFASVINPTMGTLTTLYGLYLGINCTSATTGYGIYLEGSAGSITNRWGIYQSSSSDRNYFAGNLLVGTTTDAGFKLDVAGNVRTRNTIIDGANNGNVAKLNWTRTDVSWSINNETNLRFYTSSGNTLSPSTQVLEIASTGAATFSSSVTATQFVANGNSAGGFEGLRIVNASTGAAQIVLNNSAQSWFVNTRTDNHFSVFNATSSTTPFLITTGGNVLIGTDSDNSNKLRVNGSIWADGLATLNGNFRIINSNGFNDSVNFDRTAINGLILNSSGNLILNGSTGSSRITCYGDGFFSGGIQTGNPYGTTAANWLLGRFLTETTSANGSIRVQIGSKYYNIAAEDLGTVPT